MSRYEQSKQHSSSHPQEGVPISVSDIDPEEVYEVAKKAQIHDIILSLPVCIGLPLGWFNEKMSI